MKKKGIFFLALILIIIFLTSFGIAEAVGKGFCPILEGGLVPCGRKTDDPRTPDICECYPCELCHLFVLFKRIVDFVTINIIFPLAVLMFVVGGVILLTATGDPRKISQGKKILTTAVIGLVIIFAAWLIVNTIIVFITPATSPFQAWYEIYCPYCGDGICDPDRGENPITCPLDCLAFIWVPLSGFDPNPGMPDKLAQISLTDGSIIDTYDVGDNPSRLTVIPGGDVWVGNRDDGQASVTRLTPDENNLPHYNVVDTYLRGGAGGTRAVTYDLNGDIWIGNAYDDTIMKLDPETGNLIAGPLTVGTSGFGPYGAIGDPFGYVWISNRGGSKVDIIDINKDSLVGSVPLPAAAGDVYGIGMDNEGDIWIVENAGSGRFCEIIGMKDPNLLPADRYDSNRCYFTGAGGGWGKARGIAVDGNNNVWVASSSDGHIRVFDQKGNQLCDINVGGDPVGVAIDRANNGWVVEQISGEIDALWAIGKRDEDGNLIQCTHLPFSPVPVGGNPYNYSDMTGFRSIGCPKPR